MNKKKNGGGGGGKIIEMSLVQQILKIVLFWKKRFIRRFLVLFPCRSDSAGQNFSSERLKPDYHLILQDGRRQKKKKKISC